MDRTSHELMRDQACAAIDLFAECDAQPIYKMAKLRNIAAYAEMLAMRLAELSRAESASNETKGTR